MRACPALLIIMLLAACNPAAPTQSPDSSANAAGYRSGLMVMQFPSSDGYVIDFSTSDFSLEEPPTVDLTIGANALQSFYAPHGILGLGPIPGCALSQTPDDEIVATLLGILRENPIRVPATDYRTAIESVTMTGDCRPFVVRTWEGDYVLLIPVAHTIGGYDRFWFVWIYAEDGVREFVVSDSAG